MYIDNDIKGLEPPNIRDGQNLHHNNQRSMEYIPSMPFHDGGAVADSRNVLMLNARSNQTSVNQLGQ